MLFLTVVVLLAWHFGRGPSALASTLSVLAYNFLFIEPRYSFDVADGQYLLTFAVMMLVGLLVGQLMASVRLQARVAGHRARRTALLYEMTRELAAMRGATDMARVAVRHVGEVFDAQVVVLLPDEHSRLDYPRAADGPPEPASYRGADLSVAQWVQDHGQPAGLGTDTLPAAIARYLPLKASDANVGQLGVLAVLPVNARRVLLPEASHLLDTFAAQLALALERSRLAERAQTAAVAAESEAVRNSLLAAVSHDMRTPLTVIGGAASSLVEAGSQLDDDARRDLAQTIVEESAQMTQLVSNVLDMTRLDSGLAAIRPEWVPLEEVVGSALRRLRRPLAQHRVSTRLDEAPALVLADPVLLEQLLYNLLENAAKFTPAGSSISITARRSVDDVDLLVADDGPGFAPDIEPDSLFDKFQRGRAEGAIGGVGLGLAICRAIARAHGGEIRAERLPAGGALFVTTLPQTGQAPVVPHEASVE
jgi:two-component system sensor histidine kinase KdpD